MIVLRRKILMNEGIMLRKIACKEGRGLTKPHLNDGNYLQTCNERKDSRNKKDAQDCFHQPTGMTCFTLTVPQLEFEDKNCILNFVCFLCKWTIITIVRCPGWEIRCWNDNHMLKQTKLKFTKCFDSHNFQTRVLSLSNSSTTICINFWVFTYRC